MAKKAATKPTSKSAKKPAKVAAKPVAKKTAKAVAKPVAKKTPKKEAAKEVVKTSGAKPQPKATEKKLPKEVAKEVAKSAPKPSALEPVKVAEVVELKPKKASKQKAEPGSAPAEKISKAEAKRLKKIEVTQGQEEAKWKELHDKYKGVKAVPYRMSETFEERTPLDHKVLGWGFILSVVNDRLEVLFETGIKQLISNYKSNN